MIHFPPPFKNWAPLSATINATISAGSAISRAVQFCFRGANTCLARARRAGLHLRHSLLGRLATVIGTALYPPFCAVCGVGTTPGAHLCGPCGAGALKIRWELGRVCTQCSRVFSGNPPLVVRCADCLARAPAFSCAIAPYHASGVVREVMHGFKYQGKRHLLGVLGPWLAEGLLDSRLRDPPPQVLVPVPLHWWKLRRRGFNQAALLAQALVLESERAGKRAQGHPHNPALGACLHIGQALRVEELLRRHRATGTQTALDRGARLKNLREAFSLRKGAQVVGRHIVLVDDVLTTGATLDACAQVLLAAGAASVRALAVARG